MNLQSEAHVGALVVHKVANHTGEIYRVKPWGVLVFNRNRGCEKEEWSFSAITVRVPRLVKRYPRPVRIPRETPTLLCHCRIGKLEVQGEEVICQRCGNPISTESFPNRIRRAAELFRKARSSSGQKISSSEGVGGPHKRSTSRRRKRNAVRSKKNSTKRRVRLSAKGRTGSKKTARSSGKEKPRDGEVLGPTIPSGEVAVPQTISPTQEKEEVQLGKSILA